MSPSFTTSFPVASLARATIPTAISATAKAPGARTALDEHSTTGEFARVDSAWRDWVSNGKKT